MSVLPFDQRDEYLWTNGSLTAWRDAKLHVLSHGLHYASCVFEGERAYGGRIFKSTEHSERFRASAGTARFRDSPIPWRNSTGRSSSPSTRTICKIAMSARSPGAAAK